MWISWITAGSEDSISLLGYQCYSLYTSSLVIALTRIIHHVRIAEIAAQRSVAEHIEVYYLGPKMIQLLTDLQGQILFIWNRLCYVMGHLAPFEALWQRMS